jgi:hypothetical protein
MASTSSSGSVAGADGVGRPFYERYPGTELLGPAGCGQARDAGTDYHQIKLRVQFASRRYRSVVSSRAEPSIIAPEVITPTSCAGA